MPIPVPRATGTVANEGDEDEVARNSEVAPRAASRVRVAPALAPTALPPPVASDAAFTLSALPSCVVLLATTGAPAPVQNEDRARSMDAGFDRHLTKPVDIGALERLVAEAPRIARARATG